MLFNWTFTEFLAIFGLFFIIIPLWFAVMIRVFYSSQARSMIDTVANLKAEGKIK